MEAPCHKPAYCRVWGLLVRCAHSPFPSKSEPRPRSGGGLEPIAGAEQANIQGEGVHPCQARTTVQGDQSIQVTRSRASGQRGGIWRLDLRD